MNYIFRMIVRELSGPNSNASVGNITLASLFRNSGNTSMHRSTNKCCNVSVFPVQNYIIQLPGIIRACDVVDSPDLSKMF